MVYISCVLIVLEYSLYNIVKIRMSFRIVKSIVKNANKNVFNIRSMGTYKTSTGLVGLAVQPDGNNVLLEVSKKALDSIKVNIYFYWRVICFLSIFRRVYNLQLSIIYVLYFAMIYIVVIIVYSVFLPKLNIELRLKELLTSSLKLAMKKEMM